MASRTVTTASANTSRRNRTARFPIACICHVCDREAYGLIWVSLGGGKQPLPDFPAWNDPDFQQILPPSIDINASAGRQTEGFIDVAHFAWIHHHSFADRHNPVVPQYSVERRERGMHAEYVSTVSNFPKSMQHRAPEGFRGVASSKWTCRSSRV